MAKKPEKLNPYKSSGRERQSEEIAQGVEDYAHERAEPKRPSGGRSRGAAPKTRSPRGDASNKSGKQSTAKKLASAHRGFEPIPAASPVAGASGAHKRKTTPKQASSPYGEKKGPADPVEAVIETEVEK